MKRFFTFAFLSLPFWSSAQTISPVLPFTDGAPAALHNPAAIIDGDSSIQVALMHQSKILLKPLAESHLMVAGGRKSGRIALGMRYSGYELFNRTNIGLNYARSLTNQVAMGVRFDVYRMVQGEDYGSAQAMTGSVGVLCKVSNTLISSVYIQNPNRAALGDVRTPTILNASIAWHASKQAVITAGVMKAGEQLLAYQLQADYAPSQRFKIRLGVSNGFEMFNMGCAITASSFELGMFSAYHQIFGFSPGAFVRFRKK